MTPIYPIPQTLNQPQADSLKLQLSRVAEDLIASLPAPGQLSAEGRRGIIARYSAVLEGNFIYWMTGAYLAAKTQEARSIIQDNLLEEVRDCHPGMLRKFAMAARCDPRRIRCAGYLSATVRRPPVHRTALPRAADRNDGLL